MPFVYQRPVAIPCRQLRVWFVQDCEQRFFFGQVTSTNRENRPRPNIPHPLSMEDGLEFASFPPIGCCATVRPARVRPAKCQFLQTSPEEICCLAVQS